MKPERISLAATLPRWSGIIATLLSSAAYSATWDGAVPANFNDAPSWDTDLVPVAAETATLSNAGTILVPAGVTAPATGALGTFTVSNGTLSVSGGTLTMGANISIGATGVVNISAGTVSGSTLGASGIATNGGLVPSAAGGTWSISGGTVNLNGISANSGGNHGISGGNVSTLDLRNSGTTTTGGSTITISGGTVVPGKVTAGSSGIGTIVVSGTGVVNQNIAGQAAGGSNNELWIGNNVSTGAITLKDSGQWNYTFYNANSSVNFGRGSGNHVFTIQDHASFTASAGTGALKAIDVGATSATSRCTVNLNGGTMTVLGFTKSTGSGVINANGTLIKAAGFSTNFFNGFSGTGGEANTSNSVNLLAGGLKFDTNDADVTITNVLSGAGGLEKLGAGALTLTGNSTYTGNTTVTAGQLNMGAASLADGSTFTVATDATVNLVHGIEDIVGSLVVDGVTYSSGTVGSFESTATVQLPQFLGLGKIRIGPPPVGRDLVWTAATSNFWTTLFEDSNFTVAGSPTIFQVNDNVLFDDSSNVTTVLLSGNVQAGTITFNGASDYTLDGTSSGISGEASIVKNSSGTVTLGGMTSNFTGTIAVNAGTLVKADNSSFGSTSGITIANGAQVNINGKGSSSIHTYTIGGTGPEGSGAIINTGGDIFSSGGVKNLILTADSTIGNNGGRFDVGGGGGTITGNGHTLTKIGTSAMAFRGNASGSPIHYIIAGGAAWTENSALGFGGATGTVTVKSGARVGNVGDFSIATPVTVESGGRIYSNGGTGTWTGTVALQGEATIDGAVGAVVINGALTGTANVTKTGPASVTFGNIGYTGNTTVDMGRLILAATGLPDDSDVTVDSDASLELTHGLQDTIDTLRLGGVPATAGIWGSATSGAANTSPLLVGSGTLLVLTTGTTPFDDWAAGLPEGQRNRESDPDGDGFSNLEEYLFGTDPAVNTGSLLQSVPSGATLVITWNQRNAGATYQLQERSADLETVWPASAIPVEDAPDQTGVPANYTRKQAVVPIDSARKFVRVNGTEV
jgi:autotransporter-associated beta strand protein